MLNAGIAGYHNIIDLGINKTLRGTGFYLNYSIVHELT